MTKPARGKKLRAHGPHCFRMMMVMVMMIMMTRRRRRRRKRRGSRRMWMMTAVVVVDSVLSAVPSKKVQRGDSKETSTTGFLDYESAGRSE